MKKNKAKTDTKKIVLEIVLIPLCIMYLYYILLNNHPKINIVILHLFTFIASGVFIKKYIQEVYVYNSKYNFLKVLYTIICLVTIAFIFLNIFLKIKWIQIVYIALLIATLIHLLFVAIKGIIGITNGKGSLYKNAFSAYFSLVSFVVILMGIIILL